MIWMDDTAKQIRAELLALAKEKAREFDHGGPRQWLTCSVRSYNEPGSEVTMHVMEGTPARCVIIDNIERGWCLLINGEGRFVGCARWDMLKDKAVWSRQPKRRW